MARKKAERAVPYEERYTVENYGKDFFSAVAIFDDPVWRQAAFGVAGEVTLDEKDNLSVEGRRITETDISVIRLNIERSGPRGPKGRPISFSSRMVRQALTFLAERNAEREPE